MEYFETATSRDILSALFPDHAWHSMNGAERSGDWVTISCTCTSEKRFMIETAEIKKKGLEVGMLMTRLTQLTQTGRKQ